MTTVLHHHDDLTAGSLRSRASSIITTTTKFSLETISQDDRSSIVAVHARQRPDLSNRPQSLLSMTSFARPAPPYDATLDSTLLLPTHRDGDFQPPHSPPPEHKEAPAASADAPSLNEALPPTSSASDSATASPAHEDSPLDLDNPSAQVTYYNHVVRTLDQNYTAELERLRAQHTQELAATRHDIDQAYRVQWKAKNQEIERIREEAAEEIEKVRKELGERVKGLEEEVERVKGSLEEGLREKEEEKEREVQKARHQVEDLWERRWIERGRVEGEGDERG
ncbi:MAG: hypothetical protein L6R39_004394 [Caloplaca ligustica]|nr:MAG: hypothetical protein L6R39_004394 [Caloplaca ligustica]